MTNNTGSITEEGPHLSDWEDPSLDAEDGGDLIECSNAIAVKEVQSTPTVGLHDNSGTSAIDNNTVFSTCNSDELVATLGCQEEANSKETVDTVTLNSPPENSNISVATNRPTNSIYLEDGDALGKNTGCKMDVKPMRMTMVCGCVYLSLHHYAVSIK